jgi:hypothetical protein
MAQIRRLRRERARGRVAYALNEKEYVATVPTTIPHDRVLVHNHVRPTHRLGVNGFRAWLCPADPAKYEHCPCAWMPERGAHYRVIDAWAPRDGSGSRHGRTA